jgi:hypothetical protein
VGLDLGALGQATNLVLWKKGLHHPNGAKRRRGSATSSLHHTTAVAKWRWRGSARLSFHLSIGRSFRSNVLPLNARAPSWLYIYHQDISSPSSTVVTWYPEDPSSLFGWSFDPVICGSVLLSFVPFCDIMMAHHQDILRRRGQCPRTTHPTHKPSAVNSEIKQNFRAKFRFPSI